MSRPDPLDDARFVLALTRVVYRVRRRAARNGQPAGPAAQITIRLGQALAAAVEAAELAKGDDRQRKLGEVARLVGELAKTVQPRRDSLRALLLEAIAGIQGE